jgi:general secretion pathway protein I
MIATRRRAGRSRSGFTLVEVLAALVIMGIVLPVALTGASLALRAGSLARHQAEAASLGEAKLTEMVSTGEWDSAGGDGDFGSDFPQYHWTLQRAQHDFDVTELMLSVVWKERGEDRSVNVSTLVFIPTNTGTGSTAAGSGGAP